MRRRDIVHLRDGRGDCYLGPPDAFDRRFRLVRRREVGRLGDRLQVFVNRPDAMAALRRVLARQSDGGTQIWRISDRDVIAVLRHRLSGGRLAMIFGKPAAPATSRRRGALSASLSEFAHLASKSTSASVAGKMPGGARQSASGAAPESPVGPVAAWSLEDRIERVLRLTLDKLPANMRSEFAELISPMSIGITVGIIVIWAASHGTPVGPAVDIILLLVGIVALGWGIFEAASALYDFIVAIIGANSEQDLDRAAQHLARAIALLGVAAFAALLRRIGRTGRPRDRGRTTTPASPGPEPPAPPPLEVGRVPRPSRPQERGQTASGSDAGLSGNRTRPPATRPTPQQSATAEELGVDPGWVKPDGNVDWPPNNGFSGTPEPVSLRPGVRIDRYGSANGGFLSPAGTPFDQRALPNGSANSQFTTYEVVKPLPVNSGPAAPWFGQPGGGTQYQLRGGNVQQMIDEGYIKVVN